MMASSWRDYRSHGAGGDACDNSDNRDDRSDSAAQTGANVPNVTNVTALPADIRRGLISLANAPVPRVCLSERWPLAVSDASRVASDGWALNALALGWSPTDLFGVDPDGNPYADGLAAWLRGRDLRAITEHWAVARDATGDRQYFNRPRAEGAVLIWALGRGR